MDVFYSIAAPVSAEFKEKGSKFLSFAYPVRNEEEIKEALKILKEKYWDASHHCYGWMIGPRSELCRANDAGEPNHSAGDPILSQLRSFGVTNTLIVVVRYFGGTKLGVSGLISAYKESARLVLEHARIIEQYLTVAYEISFGFEQMSIVMKAVKQYDCEVLEQTFDPETLKNIIRIRIRKGREESFLSDLQGSLGIEITSGL